MELLWLWCRLAAVALIGSLTWELPYAVSVALKQNKTKNLTSLCMMANVWSRPVFVLRESLSGLRRHLSKYVPPYGGTLLQTESLVLKTRIKGNKKKEKTRY